MTEEGKIVAAVDEMQKEASQYEQHQKEREERRLRTRLQFERNWRYDPRLVEQPRLMRLKSVCASQKGCLKTLLLMMRTKKRKHAEGSQARHRSLFADEKKLKEEEEGRDKAEASLWVAHKRNQTKRQWRE